MNRVRITKIFNFEMGHALVNYDGKCAHIHGHSYVLEVTLIGKPNANPESSKRGMVMDFSDLKKVTYDKVIDIFDHALVLQEKDKRAKAIAQEENLLLVSYQPTCENLLLDIVDKLQPALSKLGELFSIKLHETATSFAEWYASDN